MEPPGRIVNVPLPLLKASVRIICKHMPVPFIIVGGGSIVIGYGGCRMTIDVDVLIPSDAEAGDVQARLLATGQFFMRDGQAYVRPQRQDLHTSTTMSTCATSNVPSATGASSTTEVGDIGVEYAPLSYDLMSDIINTLTYEKLLPHTTFVADFGVLVPTLSMSLGIKLKTWYLRSESCAGNNKDQSDLSDIVFLAGRLRERGERVADGAAETVKITHYNLLLIRLEAGEDVAAVLAAVGATKFLEPWAQQSEDAQQYYVMMGAEADSNPLTVDISDE
jgi:hypothetical protein